MNKHHFIFFFLSLLILIPACRHRGSGGGVSSSASQGRRATFGGKPTIGPVSALFNPLPASVTVTFPGEVDMSSVSVDDLKILGIGSCPEFPLISTSNSGHVMTVLLNSTGCSHMNQIRVKVLMAGILNDSGLSGAGEFEETYTLNTDSATSPSVNLATGSYSSLSGSFSMLFNNTIDMTSVTSGMFTLRGTGGYPFDPFMNLSVVGSDATVTYDTTGCGNGDSIRVSINNSDIQDFNHRRGVGVLERVLTMDTVGITAVGNGTCPANALVSVIKVGQTATVVLNNVGCAHDNKVT